MRYESKRWSQTHLQHAPSALVLSSNVAFHVSELIRGIDIETVVRLQPEDKERLRVRNRASTPRHSPPSFARARLQYQLPASRSRADRLHTLGPRLEVRSSPSICDACLRASRRLRWSSDLFM